MKILKQKHLPQQQLILLTLVLTPVPVLLSLPHLKQKMKKKIKIGRVLEQTQNDNKVNNKKSIAK